MLKCKAFRYRYRDTENSSQNLKFFLIDRLTNIENENKDQIDNVLLENVIF